MLSEEQIRDGFRAAGYTPEEIEVYTQAMRKRIAELARAVMRRMSRTRSEAREIQS